MPESSSYRDNEAVTPTVTVVICTIGRSNDVRRCVGSLASQSMSDFEVLIVDNGTSQEILPLALELDSSEMRVRYVREPRSGLTYARRRAWKEANGALVGYLDDDAVAHPAWVASAVAAFASDDPAVAMVGGPVHDVRDLPEPWPFTDDPGEGGLNLGRDRRVVGPSENLWGGNFVVRRDVLASLDAFGEPLGHRNGRPGANEDIIIQRQLDRAGFLRVYEPQLQIVHHSWRAKASESERLRLAFYTGVDNAMMSRLLGADSFSERAREIASRVGRLRAQTGAWARYQRLGDSAEAIRAQSAAMLSLGVMYGMSWPVRKPAAKPRD